MVRNEADWLTCPYAWHVDTGCTLAVAAAAYSPYANKVRLHRRSGIADDCWAATI